MTDQALFPVFLKLEGRRVLLVGGGGVAATRLGELTRAGAYVTVVAPEIRPAIMTAGPSVGYYFVDRQCQLLGYLSQQGDGHHARVLCHAQISSPVVSQTPSCFAM